VAAAHWHEMGLRKSMVGHLTISIPRIPNRRSGTYRGGTPHLRSADFGCNVDVDRGQQLHTSFTFHFQLSRPCQTTSRSRSFYSNDSFHERAASGKALLLFLNETLRDHFWTIVLDGVARHVSTAKILASFRSLGCSGAFESSTATF
jgi:hypothetical protein